MVFRFGIALLGTLACVFGWASVLSFDLADPPSECVWPPNATASNWCGPVGAWVAFQAFTYLGIGTYPLLVLLTWGLILWLRGNALSDLWLRVVGVALVTTAAAAAGAIVPLSRDGYPLLGPGGVVGTAMARLMVPHLQLFGTGILLLGGLLVGLWLAAVDLMLGFARGAAWTYRNSTPVLRVGGQVVAAAGTAVVQAGATVAQAGAAVRNGVTGLSTRLASVNVGTVRTPAANGVVTGSRTGRIRSLPIPADLDDEAQTASQATVERASRSAAGKSNEGSMTRDGVAGLGTAPAARAAPPRLPEESAPEPIPRQLIVKDVTPKKPAAPPPKKEQPRLFEINPSDPAYALPPMDVLEEAVPIDKGAIETLCREKALILEQTLNEFRLEVQVVAIETGPVITVFELKLAPGIKVSQIQSLTNDMARALRAPAVRVVAPLPGKNTIGIEVPNIDKEKVRLRDIIENFNFRGENFAIPLYLGKDASGAPLVTDLTRMPHLLIAGTTGSGKSVCISSIIMSILLTRTPEEVNLVLVDPKVVELAMFKDVPHLMCPIVTDVSKAEGILDWAATKMDERYELLAEAGVKDIKSYNRLGREELKTRMQADDEDMNKIPVRLPYVVIVIDELADLMMQSPKEVEFFLCRIAQKSRAVGIHLIVSTQRPQANVVTGLIKSNLPSRIAFRVSSRLDSRIVLDQNGGEVLMGQGDMLFLPPGSAKLLRAQGTYIADDELKKVVYHCRGQRQPQYHPELVRIPGKSDGAGGTEERDELFDQAVEIILECGRGSVSLLQRKLTIGYGRASRLVDQMYAAGIVGEYKGSQAREVLMSLEDWRAVRSQRDTEEKAEQAEEGNA